MAQLLPTLEGRAAWTGADLERSGDWIRVLDDAQCQEMAEALASLRRRGLTYPNFTIDDFPLPRSAALLADVADELENGLGAVRLRGLDATRFTEDDLRQVFWGIGCHLGIALYQNAKGEIMGEVRDETRLATKTYEPLEPGKIASSRSRARSTGPLRWHTDRSDVIALLCVRNARAGGVSKLASIVTIYNEIRRRRPDLLELLCQDYWRSRPADEDGRSAERAFALPVFSVLDGKITCQYSRTYVEQAQEFAEVPRLTPAQNEALDLLAAVADETCLHCPFEPGDIQLLNNHVIFHGRTAYEDDVDTHQDRLLLRLWFAMPNSRRLPVGHEILWGSTQPGAVRGGVVQSTDGARTVPAQNASRAMASAAD
jgi:Taurine catabolism dioxygenase TauD, TfdA family